MKTSVLLVLVVMLWACPLRAAMEQTAQVPTLQQDRHYSGVAELVAEVSSEAGQVFDNFYSATVVKVQPFVFVTPEGEKRLTPLGETLADQMIAAINNGRIDFDAPRRYEQRLTGVIQEVDGYLRIHISGFNGQALRRSYTANVEMSEALYRALYADSF